MRIQSALRIDSGRATSYAEVILGRTRSRRYFRLADDSPRIVLIRGFTAWLLFFRDGSNDQLASAAPRQRPFSLRDGSSDKFLNLWTRQRRRGLDPDKAVLAAAAEEQLMRIGESGSVVERQPNSIRVCGNGQDAIGRSLGRAVPNHEKVVVVINQFISCGQTLAQHFAH